MGNPTKFTFEEGDNIPADSFNTIDPDNIISPPSSEAYKLLRLNSLGAIPNNFLEFGGDSSDGAIDSNGDIVLDVGGNDVCVKNYTSFKLNLADTLSVSNQGDNGVLLWIRVKGDVTISGTIDLSKKGGKGGISASDSGNGTTGAGGISTSNQGYANGGGGGNKGPSTPDLAAGGGGASLINNGQDAIESRKTAYGGIAPIKLFNKYAVQISNILEISAGGGGGGGGWEYDDNEGTPGGGGGGGSVIVIANSIITNTGTINVAGGAGGVAVGVNDGDGGLGGGAIIIECLGELIFDGTINVSGEDGKDSEQSIDGGDGGDGAFLVIQNKIWLTYKTI